MSLVNQCKNCMGFGWEPSVYEGRRPCSWCAVTSVETEDSSIKSQVHEMRMSKINDVVEIKEAVTKWEAATENLTEAPEGD